MPQFDTKLFVFNQTTSIFKFLRPRPFKGQLCIFQAP